MLVVLLSFHILLGLSLVAAFVTRYVMVLRGKTVQGHGLIAVLATALVASGVALVIVAGQPLTSACLASLGIIALTLALEGGLQVAKRASEEGH